MFTHKGKTRTLKHNLRIASLLSFVAGIVNVGGFLAVQRLTTNVTGLFTDLGIELSQLFFYKQKEQKSKLYSSIKLRLTIITFFLLVDF